MLISANNAIFCAKEIKKIQMTRIKRILLSVILGILPNSKSRIRFIKKHHLYGAIGENCLIQKVKLPLYSNLIYIHDNVKIASNVGFVTHDVIHSMLNTKYGDKKFLERVGCIEIMDNVFIGSGTRILYNTRIGTNVIIGSGSLVNKDIPDNSVYAGVPAHYICSFDDYVEKAKFYSEDFINKYGTQELRYVNDDMAKKLYIAFINSR